MVQVLPNAPLLDYKQALGEVQQAMRNHLRRFKGGQFGPMCPC